MRKKFGMILIGVCMAATLTACGGNTEKKDTTTTTETTEVTEATEAASTKKDYKLEDCIVLGEYKNLAMEVEAVSDDALQTAIDTELQNASSYEQIKEGNVKEGDVANIDYVGKKDGVAFDGGTAQGYDLSIGSGTFIEGFEDGLIGVKIGDTVDLNLTFPENYQSSELAGQDVVFTVTVNYVQGKQIVPELNEEYLTANTTYKTVEEYKEAKKAELLASNQTTAENSVWMTAVENSQIKQYPESEMQIAYDTMMTYYENMAQYYGDTIENVLTSMGTSIETFEDDELETAQSLVKEKLTIYAIIEAENITVTEEEYNTTAQQYATDYGYTTVEEFETAVGGKEVVEEQIYMEKARQLVIDNAQTSTVEATEAATAE